MQKTNLCFSGWQHSSFYSLARITQNGTVASKMAVENRSQHMLLTQATPENCLGNYEIGAHQSCSRECAGNKNAWMAAQQCLSPCHCSAPFSHRHASCCTASCSTRAVTAFLTACSLYACWDAWPCTRLWRAQLQ